MNTLARVHIKQQEAQQAAGHRTGDGMDAAVGTDSHHAEKGSHQNGDTGGQAVQSVREIYSIYRSKYDDEQHGNGKNANVPVIAVGKRHQQCQLHIGVVNEVIKRSR